MTKIADIFNHPIGASILTTVIIAVPLWFLNFLELPGQVELLKSTTVSQGKEIRKLGEVQMFLKGVIAGKSGINTSKLKKITQEKKLDYDNLLSEIMVMLLLFTVAAMVRTWQKFMSTPL